ncbi:MAG: sugar ABC transporter ATP-binding protein [Euzebyales bacterium]|nr:sugar ABC transporter ATP-binding protein [Euzebyales bacterium]
MTTSVQPLLELRGLTKSFGGAVALDGVDLTVLPGEVHGLLGENGSGKSTLIKTLAGYHAPDSGELRVRGEKVRLPMRAGEYRSLGFEFVPQDLGLIPTMSVTENLYLEQIASPSNPVFISWAHARRRARETFRRYDIDIDPGALVEDIRPVERALLAIVRALEGLRPPSSAEDAQRSALLVLDEPTVFLPQHEVTVLFDLVRTIAARGSSVLFVSHDLDEVRQITDRVTVLRDGHVAGTAVTSETSPAQLVQLIIGRRLESFEAGHDVAGEQAKIALSVQDLTTRNLDGLNLELYEGEVLGLTGLVGSGYDDVVYALYGAIRSERGSLLIGSRSLELASLSPPRAMQLGFALVPGDRQRQGSIPTLSAAENINLLVLDRHFRGLRLRHRSLADNARALMERFDVRPAEPGLDYSSFSGGNQQKAMMAKWDQLGPRVLLLHEPTQGVDVGARQQIFSIVRGSTAGAATICASSDFEQLATICDRVGIVARGRIAAVLRGPEVTKDRIADVCFRSAASEETAVSVAALTEDAG